MSFGMTPSAIPGVRIRPPKSAPGTKRVLPKKKKRKVVKKGPPKRSSRKTTR